MRVSCLHKRPGLLLSKWEQAPAESEAVFRQAIQLRETIFRVFTSLSHDESPNEDDLVQLHQTWLENETHSTLIQTEAGFAIGMGRGGGT